MVKCSECGFLAVRAAISRNLVEAERECRKTGNFNIYSRSSQGAQILPYYALPPLCFAQGIDMREEINKAAGTDNPDYSRDPISIHLVLDEERECSEFVVWKQGSTPKEHREMLDRQWMIDREDRRDKQARNMRWAEFAVAIIALGLIVLTAFIQRGNQPTINIITDNPSEVAIEQQP